MMNLKQTRLKFSTLEGRLNMIVLAIFSLNAIIWLLSVVLRFALDTLCSF